MSVPGIFKLGRVYYAANLASGLHAFLTGKGWCSGYSCLDLDLLNVGRLSIRAESCAADKCLAAGMLQ